MQGLADALRSPAGSATADELHVRRERTRLLAAFDESLVPVPRRGRARLWLTRAVLLAVLSGLALGLVLWRSGSAPSLTPVAASVNSVNVRAEVSTKWSRQTEARGEIVRLESGTLSIHVDHALSPQRRLLVILPDGESRGHRHHVFGHRRRSPYCPSHGPRGPGHLAPPQPARARAQRRRFMDPRAHAHPYRYDGYSAPHADCSKRKICALHAARTRALHGVGVRTLHGVRARAHGICFVAPAHARPRHRLSRRHVRPQWRQQQPGRGALRRPSRAPPSRLPRRGRRVPPRSGSATRRQHERHESIRQGIPEAISARLPPRGSGGAVALARQLRRREPDKSSTRLHQLSSKSAPTRHDVFRRVHDDASQPGVVGA